MEKDNKLIAEFMELTNMEIGQWSIAEQMSNGYYHSSWDWLMPVVKKCCDIGFGSENPDFDDQWELQFDDSTSKFWSNDIKGVYESVVNFIKFVTNTNKE